MNLSTILSLLLTLFFFILSLVFWALKEKSVFLISGFNILSKEERMSYDCVKLAKDQRKIFVWCTILWFISTILCFYVTEWVIFPAFVIWFVFFLKQVHLDFDQAFEKYKK